MATKFKLSDEMLYEEAQVWGLCSAEAAQRLCYLLNEQLQLRLRRDAEDHRYMHRQHCLHFCSFSYNDERSMTSWHLTANKNAYLKPARDQAMDSGENRRSSVALVQELRHFDYFLWSEEALDREQMERIHLGLRQLRHISTQQEVSLDQYPQLNNLLTEL